MTDKVFYSTTKATHYLNCDNAPELQSYLEQYKDEGAPVLNRLLEEAAERGATKCCTMLGTHFISISCTRNHNALAWAAEEGNLDTLKALIALGIKPEAYQGNVFINALNYKKYHVCSFLAEHFITTNVPLKLTTIKAKIIQRYLTDKNITPLDYLPHVADQYRDACLQVMAR